MSSKAREFAIQAHEDQRYGDQPYVTHLDQVWAVLCEYGYDDWFYRAGAYLHDCVEDCKVRPEDIEVEFGVIVAYVVRFCTDEAGYNRKTRKANTYQERQAQIIRDWVHTSVPMPALPIAVRVKVADRIANVRNCIATGNTGLLQMYRKEAADFRNAYHVHGFCDAMWQEYDRLLTVSPC